MNRQKCKGITVRGTSCDHTVLTGEYCWRHQLNLSSKAIDPSETIPKKLDEQPGPAPAEFDCRYIVTDEQRVTELVKILETDVPILQKYIDQKEATRLAVTQWLCDWC
jgi:hypothetical protein